MLSIHAVTQAHISSYVSKQAHAHACTHAHTHARAGCWLARSIPPSLPLSLPRSLALPPTHPLNHSLTHSLNHSLTHSLTSSLTHSLEGYGGSRLRSCWYFCDIFSIWLFPLWKPACLHCCRSSANSPNFDDCRNGRYSTRWAESVVGWIIPLPVPVLQPL